MEDMLLETALTDPTKLEKRVKRYTNQIMSSRNSKVPFNGLREHSLKELRVHADALGLESKSMNRRQLASKIVTHIERIFSVPADSSDAPNFRIPLPPLPASKKHSSINKNSRSSKTHSSINSTSKTRSSNSSSSNNSASNNSSSSSKGSQRQRSSKKRSNSRHQNHDKNHDKNHHQNHDKNHDKNHDNQREENPYRREFSSKAGSKVRKRRRDRGLPTPTPPRKKPKTAFNYFQMEQQPIVSAQLAETGMSRKVLSQTVSRSVARHWKTLSAEMKQPYKDKAKADKVEYERRMQEFEQNLFSGDRGEEQGQEKGREQGQEKAGQDDHNDKSPTLKHSQPTLNPKNDAAKRVSKNERAVVECGSLNSNEEAQTLQTLQHVDVPAIASTLAAASGLDLGPTSQESATR